MHAAGKLIEALKFSNIVVDPEHQFRKSIFYGYNGFEMSVG